MIKFTLMDIPVNTTLNGIHKILHQAFSDPKDAGAVCPRYMRMGDCAVMAATKDGPMDPSIAGLVYDVVVPTGDLTLSVDIAATRKVNGHRKSFDRAKEAEGVRAKLQRKLDKYGIAIGDFSWRYQGLVDDPEHKCRIPHGTAHATIHCDDPAAIESLILDGIGPGRYLGLGMPIIKRA